MATDSEVFKPSELIINSRGAVYHLNLRPDELADTVILVGDPARTDKVARFFDSIELRQEHREFESITGSINGQRVTVLSTGIGTDNIDIVLTELDALANIDFETRREKAEKKSLRLIRLGTSGSLSAATWPVPEPASSALLPTQRKPSRSHPRTFSSPSACASATATGNPSTSRPAS